MAESPSSDSQGGDPASAEIARNKAFLRDVIERMWITQQGLDELARHISPGYVHHAPFVDLTFDQFRGGVTAIQQLSPSLRYRVTHIIAEGDLYAAHIQSVLTHTGTVMGIAATGKEIECVGIYHCRIAGGAILEDWDAWTILPVFQQFAARVQS